MSAAMLEWCAPMTRVLIGCSGWNYRDWRDGVFYPERLPAHRWLAFYAERFDSVEVNATFYRLPRREAVARWAGATPEGFMFAVKVSRFLTHVKRLRDAGSHLELLLRRLEPLVESGRLGPLLWQLPPTFHRDEERLAAALDRLPRGLRHAFEFRHESWFDEPVLQVLRAHGAALVIADGPAVRAFQTRDLTADFVYVRLHRGARGRRGNYSQAELAGWAREIAAWARERDVYAYFNNDWEGFAPANAASLRAKVRDSGPGRGHARPAAVLDRRGRLRALRAGE
jgi:uncharacterized protein YecE (DUF72 family)